MKHVLIAVALTAAFATAHAQAPTRELTSQQKLMGTCNKEATGLKGDERKKKMSTCLADGRKRQQEVMKACATQNKGKKGDEYKAAQKECLSKG